MENEHIIPGNPARGWNDPPQFLHSAQKKTSSPANLQALNKRVAHSFVPSNNSTSSATTTVSGPAIASQLAPPALLAPVPILSHEITSATDKKSTEAPQADFTLPDVTDDQEVCAYCVRCFNECVEALHCQGKIEKRLVDDVNKRIVLFEKTWTTKISDKAKPKCFKLARAMELAEWKVAHDLHLTLMTDHISEVSQWMVGIKKLIQAGQN